MSSTTTTQFYGLTQYIGTDKPDFADNNQAFRNVDADLHQVVQDSQGFTSDIADLTERVGNLDTDLTNLSRDLNGEKAKITALQNKELSQDTEISRVERNAQDMITAYNEASATSTHAYAVGDYFIYNNVLYQATATIAVGATIVPDTNCKTTNVTSELIQLNNDLATSLVATQNGSGTKSVTLDISTKKRIIAVSKNDSTLLHCVEIPTAILTNRLVIPLGKLGTSAPIVYNSNDLTGAEPQYDNKPVTLRKFVNSDVTVVWNGYNNNGTNIDIINGLYGLKANLSSVTDISSANITYNGDNSFTLTSVSGIEVSLYA